MENANPLRVLFVEDLPSDTELAEREIRKSGLEFTSQRVDTKDAFLRALKEFQPDVIVSDYMMPEFDAMQALKLSLEHDSRVPFILLTGSVNEEAAVACMKAGASDYVIKEHMTRLPFAIKEAVEQKKMSVARDEAERALRESEEKYRLLAESSPQMIYLIGRDGRVSYVNSVAAAQFHAKPLDLVGRHLTEIFPRGLAEDNLEGIQDVINSRKASVREIVQKFPSGEKWVEARLSPVIHESGEAVAVLVLSSDITERKKAEHDLRLSEEHFRLVWDKSADGMRLIDREGRIIAANEAYCRLVNMPREKLVGEIFSVVYAKGGRDGDIRIYHNRFDLREIDSHLQAAVALWNGKVLNLDISNSFIETEGEERMVLSIFRDITERKKAEQRLEEERHLLRTIIDAIPDEIAVKDKERRFILVNPETVRVLKRSSEEEIIGKRDEDLIPETFALQAKEAEDSVLATGCPSINRVGKSRINASTGEIERSILISKIPLKDSSGKVVGLVGINRDITEVQRANASLEKERTLLLTLIESIPDEICLKDIAHRYVVANSAVVRALGARSMEDIFGKTDLDFASPELAQEHFDEEDAILESGRPMINRERIRRNPMTGEIDKCLLTTKVPVRDMAGNKLGILVINRHMTERKMAEEALRASEEKYRALFQESKDVVYVSSADGRLLDINAAGVQLFGYDSKEDLLQIDLGRDGYVDPKQRDRFRDEMEKAGFVKDFEFMLKRKGGDTITVLETATAVRDKLGNVVMHRGIIRDVTRQRQLELQFLQAQKMESIGTLAGGIAHDFNNILGIILGHLALLERTRDNDAQFEESIFSINKAVERGASLVRQILTFARKTDTQLEPVSINSAIKELAKMLEETFPKTMALTLQFDKSIPVVSLDPTQLHQALLNLCVNARDAMNGQGTLTIATHLVFGRDVSSRFPKATANHYVHVCVSDTGTGMDEETRQRVFEPFFSTKEKGKGTGLGLAVVYGVLQAHSGFVDVESALGAGTSFHLFFPVPEGILAPTKERPGIQDDLPRGTETILVVEDEDILRDLLVQLLEMQGYKVIPASDGDEAVRCFNEHADEIDLVLSDMGLPKRNGWDAFKAMRETSEDIRALLASGYLDPGHKSEVLKSGVRGFIQKPYKMDEVLKAVRETLDEKE